jgi:hypothetical protein
MSYIYIMTSASWPEGTYKIGRSSDPSRRVKELFTTGLPHPVEIVHQVKVSNDVLAEKEAHRRLAAFRSNPAREFFEGSLASFMELLDDVAQQYPDPDQVEQQAQKAAAEARRKARAQREVEELMVKLAPEWDGGDRSVLSAASADVPKADWRAAAAGASHAPEEEGSLRPVVIWTGALITVWGLIFLLEYFGGI